MNNCVGNIRIVILLIYFSFYLICPITIALKYDTLSSVIRADVCVYDATAGGIMAAVAAARHGMSVVLLCASWPACFPDGGRLIGGMSTGGLGKTDIGPDMDIGGFALEFYKRNRAYYNNASFLILSDPTCRLPAKNCNVTWNLESHVAIQIFSDMMQGLHIQLVFDAQIESVERVDNVLVSLRIINQTTIISNVFVDASYEGDLMHFSNISYVYGREANTTYNESLNGRTVGFNGNQFTVAISPFSAQTGALLPLIYDGDTGVPGTSDNKLPAYNFRLCVTQDPDNMVPFYLPNNYNITEWELLRRWCNATQNCGGLPSGNTAPIPNKKFDMNNAGPVSSDFIGGSWAYPAASFIERKQLWEAHKSYVQGLLWTLSHDPGISPDIRKNMTKWGLCKDEFTTTGMQ